MTTIDNFTAFGAGNKIGRSTAMPIPNVEHGEHALILAGLNWNVEVTPLSHLLDAPLAERTFISQRSDTAAVIGVNGNKHHVIQNTALAEFGDAIRQVRPDAQYVSGGCKNNGSTTFLMLELGDGFTIGGGDKIQRQLLIGTHHDGGKLFTAGVNFRPFCMNQWAGMMRGRTRLVEVSHTATADQRIKLAIKSLQAAVTMFDEWDLALQQLLTQPAQLKQHMPAIVGDRPDKDGRALTEWENRVDRLWAEYQADWNNELIGTGLGVFMAAQGTDEHRGKVNGGKRDEQRVGRMIAGNYPLATRALRSLQAV